MLGASMAHEDVRVRAAHALAQLLDTLDETEQLLALARKRGVDIQERLRAGATWREIVTEEHRPLIVEVLSDSLLRLMDAGSRFRREEARALHDEGLTMEAVAVLFGVTRQRISHLLRVTADDPDQAARRVTNRRSRPSSKSISAAMSDTD